MRAAALSPPRPSPGPLAAEGKLVTSFVYTAVIVLSPNHAVYTSPARTARTPLLPVRALRPPRPAAVSRNGRGCAQRKPFIRRCRAHALFSPTLRRKKTRAPPPSPSGGADALTSSPPPPAPSRSDAPAGHRHPHPAALTPRAHTAARGGRRFGPDTQQWPGPSFCVFLRPHALRAPASALSPRLRTDSCGQDKGRGQGRGAGAHENPPRAARRGGIMSRPVCTAP